jgi:Undecaprenyl-phosphate glucose phosphotransferase
MLLRLRIYRLALRTIVYLLAFPAFQLGWQIWAICMKALDRPALYAQHGHTTVIIFSSLVWAYMAEHYKVTNVDELFRERTGARATWSAAFATTVVLLATLYFMRNIIFPRALFVCGVAVLVVLTLLVRVLFRFLYRRKLRLGRPSQLLIVGADQFACDAALRLKLISFVPCEVVGYVRLPGQEVAVENTAVHELENLSELHPGTGVDEVVMAIHPAQFSQIPQIMKALEKLCVPARAIVDLGEGIVVRERLFQLGRLQMLDLTTTPNDLPDYILLKRIFDICFSTVALLLASPLMFLIALAIRLTSPGPIFFTQERIGLNGLPFRMYKFRSITLSSTESDTRWTVGADPRCGRFGRFLRKTSLDELPQFINVLKGEMSVVGPRPERPYFVNQFLNEVSRYNQRHCLKVGITGWAQVNGWRGDTSIGKRVEHDLYYIQNWTLGFDLRIILLTILSAMPRRKET